MKIQNLETLERDDIQGLVAGSYGKLQHACYVLVTFDTGAGARAWLREALPGITPASQRPSDKALNVALTHAGLRLMELDDEMLPRFLPELIEGMTAPHRRRILGDVSASAPDTWYWGGPNNAAIHVVLFMYAVSAAALDAFYTLEAERLTTHGARELQRLNTYPLVTNREHFGFRDGVSQPLNFGSTENVVPAGEFILGYKNAYDKFPESPGSTVAGVRSMALPQQRKRGNVLQDFGRNGTYVVMRQLAQDVPLFWRTLVDRTRNPDETPNIDAAIRLGAKITGRWPSGAPLVESPMHDDPALAESNSFGFYAQDYYGERCPLGSHIRRTNPRDALERAFTPPELALQISNRHRILRRGRIYGAPLVDSLEPREAIAKLLAEPGLKSADERGLMFICLNANIQRQFEFIQHTWANNPKFEGLYDEVDVISGNQLADGCPFTMQASPVRERVNHIPRFVQVRGGAYFFMPGMKALQYLADLP